jgi:uncharacterized DUF497 family protein
MLLEFDEAKSARNLEERGIGFERFADMDLTRSISREDTRVEYGERCIGLVGPIGGRLHVAVITYRGERVRVISLRRANSREERRYAKESQPS